ncbi:MAG TPA: RDD family protein, partial [Candidatus Cybelea sp.]|nr:RDD family protein [Candidatus Cybelea sp.]
IDGRKTGHRHEQLVAIGKDVELKAEDSAGEVVVIGGSARIHGAVDGNVVVVGGNIVLDGHVGGQVVSIMGDALIGSAAKVHGDLVTVGGTNQVAEGASVEGQIVELGAGGGPLKFLQMGWLKDWFTQCVMEMRPLSPSVGWIWWIAGFFVIIYFLIAVLFPHPVQACAAQVSARPGTTFAVGLLAKLAIPLLSLVLIATGVGILVLPFFVLGVFLTMLIGRVAVLEYIGDRIGGIFGMKEGQRPLAAFLIGVVIVTLLYMVPVVGWLTLLLLSFWAMGAGLTAIFVALRSARAARAAAIPPPAPPTTASAPPNPPASSEPSAGSPPALSRPALTPPSALAYPRAGFWERMGAGFLDMVLVMVISALLPPFFALVAMAYFSAMWAWKGTTVGGIVLNLQVVRQDGLPLNFLAAFVRSLAALFSAAVLFLGFLWIGWDPNKQGWHDKIAGTVVVRLPKAVSLVCF